MSQGLSKIQIALKVTTVCAWIFAIGTLVTLLVTASMLMADEDGAAQIRGGIGLDYQGLAGAVMIITELVIVPAGIIMSMLKQPMMRRIGHGILVAWCGLWLLNAVSVAKADNLVLMWTFMVPALILMFASTIVRAVRGWSASQPVVA